MPSHQERVRRNYDDEPKAKATPACPYCLSTENVAPTPFNLHPFFCFGCDRAFGPPGRSEVPLLPDPAATRGTRYETYEEWRLRLMLARVPLARLDRRSYELARTYPWNVNAVANVRSFDV